VVHGALRRSFPKLRAGHPERSQHAVAERHREGTAIARLEHRSERVKTWRSSRFRLCPRLREDPVPVERQPDAWREQVPDGGGGRPGAIVEVDRPASSIAVRTRVAVASLVTTPSGDAVRVTCVAAMTIGFHERHGA
jgi:hypothetical protein